MNKLMDKLMDNIDVKIFEEDGNSPNSVFLYIPQVFSPSSQKGLLGNLDSLPNFQNNFNFKEDAIIRQQKWYHHDQTYFCPRWTFKYDRWKSHEYEEFLMVVEHRIQKLINNLKLESRFGISTPQINSCLVNKYRSGKDYIRPHRDTYLTFGTEPTIVGLSLGATREIMFRRVVYEPNKKLPKYDVDTSKNFSFQLESGSLFIMAGSSQKMFTHEIPRLNEDGTDNEVMDNEVMDNEVMDNEVEEAVGGQVNKNHLRYSLTFRETMI